MAHLVRVTEDEASSSASEHRAHSILRDALPAAWVITTNVQEHNFEGLRGKREFDSILISPLGVFIIDFKDLRGVTKPSTNGSWVRSDGTHIKNPFSQIRRGWTFLANFLQTRLGLKVWIDGLIVLTHRSGRIDWDDSDVEPDLRARVVDINEVEKGIRQLASLESRYLDLQTARKVLQALKPSHVPKEAFSGWTTKIDAFLPPVNAEPQEQTGRVTSLAQGVGFDAEAVIRETAQQGGATKTKRERLIRQSFSHGRSKAVLFETVQRTGYVGSSVGKVSLDGVRSQRFTAERLPEKARLAAERAISARLLSTKVDSLSIPLRLIRLLRKAGIVRVGDLVQKTDMQILEMPHIGSLSLMHIIVALDKLRLRLGMEVEDWPSDANAR